MSGSTVLDLTNAGLPLDGTEALYGAQGGADRQMASRDVASLVDTTASLTWNAGDVLNARTLFTAATPMLITGVIARIDAANGTAATLALRKAPSGTVFSGGTLLTATTVNLAGTVATNQAPTLSVVGGALALAAGDSIGMITTGSLVLSAGCITVHMVSQNS